MDEAINKINSDEKFNKNELKSSISNLQSKFHKLNTKITQIKNHKPLLISHKPTANFLPEQILLLSTAYKNFLFIYNSFMRIKQINKEIKQIYPINLSKISEIFDKYKEMKKFQESLNFYHKLDCVNKLGVDIEIQVIGYDIFSDPDFSEEVFRIAKEMPSWSDKLEKETKRIIIKKVTHFSLKEEEKEEIINDFKILANKKKELIDFYFKELKNKLNKKENDFSEILSLIEFDYEFKLGNDSNFIYLPSLLENKTNLIEKYTFYSQEKIENWMNNIKCSIINARNQPPQLDEHNKFICLYFITLLDLIKNQIEPIRFSKELREKIEAIIERGVKELTDEIKELMQNEFSKAVNANGAPGYEEYVIMISNSSLKLAQFANDSLESKALSDYFVELMHISISLLGNFVIFTCKPILNLIFTEKWYQREKSVIPTLSDFLSDYKSRMHEYNFNELGINLSEKIAVYYLNQLKRNRAKLYDDASFIIKKDYLDLEEIFYNYKINIKCNKLRELKELLDKEGEVFLTEVNGMKDWLSKECVIAIIRKKESFDDKEEFIKRVRKIYGEKGEKGIFKKIFG